MMSEKTRATISTILLFAAFLAALNYGLHRITVRDCNRGIVAACHEIDR